LSGETVLIAAFSARALAASARRAGYLPLVVDCFGDDDTMAHAASAKCLPARVQTGFIPKTLRAALEELTALAATPPIGLVLGPGFECNPRLVAGLASRYRLIGNSPDVIARTKSPETFFTALDRLGIVHPDTRLTPPPDPAGWLMKRTGGTGGLHIVNCPTTPRPDPRRYFQRKVDGIPISLLGVVGRRGNAFAATRQWTSPIARRPYRYGGGTGALTLEPDLEARLIDIALAVSNELALVGLVSFDFLLSGDEASLLEVNPRPGATLDMLDDSSGSLFQSHVDAVLSGDGATHLKSAWRPPAARASAFLYADQGVLTVPVIEWPKWAADRPRAGTQLAARQPVATVMAEGSDPDHAEALCRDRLGVLGNMLYEGKNSGKGASIT
jgi:uncharacterized protein